MKTKSGNKIKKNKIPICPKKVKPIINIHLFLKFYKKLFV